MASQYEEMQALNKSYVKERVRRMKAYDNMMWRDGRRHKPSPVRSHYDSTFSDNEDVPVKLSDNH